MTQTQSNYADLFSTDDRIRINALKAIAPQKTPFEIVKSLGKTDPKWNPTQAQLVTAIHGVTQLVMWLQEGGNIAKLSPGAGVASNTYCQCTDKIAGTRIIMLPFERAIQSNGFADTYQSTGTRW